MKFIKENRNKKWLLHPTFMIALLLTIGFLGHVPAQAAPLNLTLLDFPDIASAFIDVTYDAGADIFSATGVALTFDDDGSVPPEPIQGGTFNIATNINSAGQLQPGGTLSIGGTIPTLGLNSGTLLTGDLTAFGFPDAGGNPLEFQFDVTGGDLAGIYGAPGFSPGVILSNTGFGGSFGVDFDNLIMGIPGTGIGVSDTAVPEPATFLLFGSGLIVLSVFRRRFRT